MKNYFIILTLLASLTLLGQETMYSVAPGNGNGLRFWNSNYYKIHMGNTSEYKYGPVTGYSIKMNMRDEVGWGWSWGLDGVAPIAAQRCWPVANR